MYSGKMFFSTQSDVAAGRYAGYFSHSIDAIIDGGAVAAAATSMSQINASSSSKAASAAAVDPVFVRWHNWRGMKNWSVCGHWREDPGRIHDVRGMMLPQLALLNYHVSPPGIYSNLNLKHHPQSSFQSTLISTCRAAPTYVATSTAAP